MKKVFISGNFNILHPGHIRLFKFAKECGDKVIVGVMADKLVKEKNYLPQEDRMESIRSISIVDEVHLISKSLKNTLEKIKPNIVIKGKEHQNLFNEETKTIKKFNGKLLFASGTSSLSSISLINNELSNLHNRNYKLPREYMKRHGIKINRLKSIIQKFQNLNVCVIGDLIIDEYIDCNTLGISQEEPTVVVSPSEKRRFLGGSGIVSAHAAGLGAKVSYLTIAGNDEEMKFAKKKLSSFGVNAELFLDESRPTTLKQRYLTNARSLLKVSHLRQHTISVSIQKKILKKVKSILPKTDLIIFSDFNYGCLPQSLVDKIIEIAAKEKVLMVADSQSSSQTGNIARFKGMDLILPTEREARISLRNNEDGLIVISDLLANETHSRYIILKLGADGILIEDTIAKKPKKNDKWYTDRLQSFNSNPVDVAGAGDSLLVGSALTLAVKGNIWESSLIGSIMSSIQVSRIGNIPIKTKDLIGRVI